MIKDCHRNGLSGYLGFRIGIYVHVEVIPAKIRKIISLISQTH